MTISNTVSTARSTNYIFLTNDSNLTSSINSFDHAERYLTVQVVQCTRANNTGYSHEMTLTVINELISLIILVLDLYTNCTRNQLTTYDIIIISRSTINSQIRLEMTHSLNILVVISTQVRNNRTQIAYTKNIKPVEQTIRLIKITLD